jgi:hypothetical protein
LCNEVRGNQARVKNADLRHSSFTVVMQKTQICVTRPQCVNKEKCEHEYPPYSPNVAQVDFLPVPATEICIEETALL